MASNDIKSTHDDNPTGCDDINSDYYFQVVKDDDGTLSDEGMSIPQMRAVLQDVGPPANTDVFSLTLPDNSLTALLGPLFGNYTHWQITESATAPIYTDTEWRTWPMPTVYPESLSGLSFGTSKTFYLYTKDAFIVHSILDENGVAGISLTPVVTQSPVWADPGITVAAGASNPTYEFDIVITPPTHLVDIDRYDLEYSVDGLFVLYRIGVATTVTVGPFPAGTQQTFRVVAYDASTPTPNFSTSNPVSATTDTLGGGTVNIVAAAYEVDESGGATLNIALSRTGVAVGASTSTVNVQTAYVAGYHTAVPPTNYTAITDGGAGSVITWTNDDDTNKNASITIADTSSAENVVGELQIVLGSESNCVLGSVTETLFKINGSGGGTGRISEDTIAVDGGNIQAICLCYDTTTYTQDHTETTGVGGDNLLQVTVASGPTPTDIAVDVPVYMLAQDLAYAHAYNADPTLSYGQLAPFASHQIEITTTGNWWFWAHRLKESTSRDAVFVGLDRAEKIALNLNETFGNKDLEVTAAVNTWQWVEVSATSLPTNITATGAHTVEHYNNNPMTDQYTDRLLMVNDGDYNPATDGTLDGNNVPLSTASATTPTDDPDNPPIPVGDTDGTLAPDTLTPANGEVSASITSVMRFTYDTGTGLVITGGTATYNAGAVTLNGDWSSNNVGVGTFTPSSIVPNNITITLVPTGSIIDSSGVRRAITTTWSFTTVAASGGATLDYIDHNSETFGFKTDAEVAAIYDGLGGMGNNGVYYIDPDPDSSASRGRVARIELSALTTGGGSWIPTQYPVQNDVYMSFDIFVPIFPNRDTDPFDWSLGMKTAGLIHDDAFPDMSDVTSRGTCENGFSSRIMLNRWGSGVPGTNVISAYTYRYERHNPAVNGGLSRTGQHLRARWPKETDSDDSGVVVGIIPGQWNTIQQRIKLNTTYLGAANGFCQVWVNGYLGIDYQELEWIPSTKSWEIDTWILNCFHGGSTSDYALYYDAQYNFDNFIISTGFINSSPFRSTPWDGT